MSADTDTQAPIEQQTEAVTRPPHPEPALANTAPDVPDAAADRVARRDFRLLWGGQTVSALGSGVTELALPLTAVAYLGATPAQVGFLTSASTLPGLVLMLFAGVIVDRVRRRRLLIVADFGRAAALGLVPLLAMGHMLHMPVLYGIAFVVGALTILFQLAYPAYVATLVGREDLIRGNARMEASQQVAGIAGPGLGGVLVQLMRAPFAMALDAASFLVSAVSIGAIRHREDTPVRPADAPPPKGARGVVQDIKAGLRFTFGNRHLRALAGEAATFNLFSQIVLTLFVLYAVRDVGLSAGAVGVIFAVGGVGGTLGATHTERLVKRFGYGPVLVGATLGTIVPLIAMPMVHGAKLPATVLFSLIYAGVGYALVVAGISSVTLRQTITPDALRGRVNASFRFVTAGVLPIGAAAAGLLAEAVGARGALVIAACGVPVATLWLVFSPIPKLRRLDEIEVLEV